VKISDAPAIGAIEMYVIQEHGRMADRRLSISGLSYNPGSILSLTHGTVLCSFYCGAGFAPVGDIKNETKVASGVDFVATMKILRIWSGRDSVTTDIARRYPVIWSRHATRVIVVLTNVHDSHLPTEVGIRLWCDDKHEVVA